MTTAQIVVGHRQVSKTVTMDVTRSLLTRALSGYDTAAEDRVIILFKQQYKLVHGRSLGYLPRAGLTIEETAESQHRPQGCDCSCKYCDDQGHCRNASRGCHL